jgi:hypothetical protein
MAKKGFLWFFSAAEKVFLGTLIDAVGMDNYLKKFPGS